MYLGLDRVTKLLSALYAFSLLRTRRVSGPFKYPARRSNQLLQHRLNDFFQTILSEQLPTLALFTSTLAGPIVMALLQLPCNYSATPSAPN